VFKLTSLMSVVSTYKSKSDTLKMDTTVATNSKTKPQVAEGGGGKQRDISVRVSLPFPPPQHDSQRIFPLFVPASYIPPSLG